MDTKLKNKLEYCYAMFGLMVVGGLVTAGMTIALMSGSEYVRDNIIDKESGTVIKTNDHSIVVDIDGDNRADRVLYAFGPKQVFAEYAQPGDKISYTNRTGCAELHISDMTSNGFCKIHEINGKNAKEIKQWQRMMYNARLR